MRATLLLVLALLVGCGDDGTGPGGSIVGTWSLQSVNGTNLPFVIAQTGQNKTELTGDVYSVLAGGAFTQVTTIRTTINGAVTNQTITDSGSYTQNGTAVTFFFASDGSSVTGAVSGSTITMADDGVSGIYRKQ